MVFARCKLMGGDASLGSTDARILGCALSTCFNPSSATGSVSSLASSAGTMSAAVSAPPWRNMASNAAPAALRTLGSRSHSASRIVGTTSWM